MRASALKSAGLDAFWDNVKEFKVCREQSGEFSERRRKQALTWMWDQINTRLVADFRASAAIKSALPQVIQEVETSKVAPSSAARRLLDIFASQGT